MRTDRQTDMKKLIVAFHNFANAPKNEPFVGIFPNYNQTRVCLCFLAFHGIAVLLKLLQNRWEKSEVSPVADG
jgi:hypothetical protein